MLRRLNKSISILFLLLGWFVTQAAALQHEFSAEHWQGSAHEVCLAHAFHNDDLVEPQEQSQSVPLFVEFNCEFHSTQQVNSSPVYSPLQARAPPVNTL